MRQTDSMQSSLAIFDLLPDSPCSGHNMRGTWSAEDSHSSLLHIVLHMGDRCPQLGECGQTLTSRTVLVLAVVDDSDYEINMIDAVALIRHTVVIKLNIH